MNFTETKPVWLRISNWNPVMLLPQLIQNSRPLILGCIISFMSQLITSMAEVLFVIFTVHFSTGLAYFAGWDFYFVLELFNVYAAFDKMCKDNVV